MSLLLTLFPSLTSHRDEIDRNRQKIMEINYFLDTKQAEFDALTTESVVDVDIDDDTPLTATIETHQDDVLLAATTN
jgi:hypothetical protein